MSFPSADAATFYAPPTDASIADAMLCKCGPLSQHDLPMAAQQLHLPVSGPSAMTTSASADSGGANTGANTSSLASASGNNGSSTSVSSGTQNPPRPTNAHLAPHQPPLRRASTPSQSFLMPKFFAQSNPHESIVAGGTQHHNSNSHPSPNAPPRRTSFGTALGGRLSALSALGMGGTASGWGLGSASSTSGSQPTSGTASAAQSHPPSNAPSATASPALRPSDGPALPELAGAGAGAASKPTKPSLLSSSSTPAATTTSSVSPSISSSPAPPPAPIQSERRHICVPDGCGGFVTIEQKPRRTSHAQ